MRGKTCLSRLTGTEQLRQQVDMPKPCARLQHQVKAKRSRFEEDLDRALEPSHQLVRKRLASFETKLKAELQRVSCRARCAIERPEHFVQSNIEHGC